MKSERSHELPEGTLANKKIIELPNVGRKWAGRAALALGILVVVAALVYNRMNAAEARHHDAADQLYLAADLATSVRFSPPAQDRPIDPVYVSGLQTQYDRGRAAVGKVRDLTTDAKLLAQADVIEGDLAYSFGSLPAIPAAATRPAEFSPRPARDELMKQAAAAYQDVVDNYKDQPVNLAAAQFGLAAIAENRGDWDRAAALYQAVRTNADVAPLFKQLAENRAKALPDLKQTALLKATEVPPLISPTTAPAAAATPAATGPTTKPATQPK